MARDAGIDALVQYYDRDIPKRFGFEPEEWVKQPQSQQFALLTAQERQAVFEQVQLCSASFEYAARNYFWIVNNESQDQLFSLWESQYLVLETMRRIKERGKAQKIFVIKARRLGLSTLIEALIAWRAIFFRNVYGIVISVDEDDAAYLFGFMQHFYDKLPWWMKPEIASREIKGGLIFDRKDPVLRAVNPGNHSEVKVQYSTQFSGVGQGRRVSCAHISEMSDYEQKRAEEIVMEDLTPAIHPTPENFAFIETTGKGTGNTTHRLWRASERLADRAEWYPLFLANFFEHSRVISVPKEWSPQRPEQAVRERVRREWVKCLHCGQFQHALEDRIKMVDGICPMCVKGKMKEVILTPGQLAWMEERRIQAEANGREAVKKWKQEYAICISGESRVSTDIGIIRIPQCGKASWTETGMIEGLHYNGVRNVVRVRTKRGRELDCTPEHRFFTPEDKEVAAATLTPGQQIALSAPEFADQYYSASWAHSPTCRMVLPIEENWGRLLGYFMGDGCWRGGGISFCVDAKDEDVAQDIAGLCEKIIGHRSTIRHKGNHIIIDSNSTSKWFELLLPLGCIMPWGGNQRGYKRQVSVPECIWRSPKSVVAQFISALFECDAHAYRDTRKTAFFTKHDQFARDVQLLLLGFGINASIKSHIKTTTWGGKHKPYQYKGQFIYLHPIQSNIFHERIGFIGKRKRTTAKLGDIGKRNVTHNELRDEIESVTALPEQQNVYDLTIPKCHRFGANGLLVHNCAEDAFQVSGYSVFDDTCYEMVDRTIEDPEHNPYVRMGFIGNPDGKFHGYNPETKKCYEASCTDDHRFLSPMDSHFTMYREPVPGAEYSIGVDVSEGIGEDYSVIFVNRVGGPHMPDEEVAVWRDNWTDPKELAFFCNAIGRMYNEGLMCIEYNVYMTTGDDVLYKYQYPNIYIWKNKENRQGVMTHKYHWWTKAGHKTTLYQTARSWMRTGAWIIHSKTFRDEMATFVKEEYEDRSAKHSQDQHDDLLMAGMIALYCPHELDTSESTGRIPVPQIATKEGPKDWVMHCDSCGAEWEAERPDVFFTCPAQDPETGDTCGSIRLRGTKKAQEDTGAKIDIPQIGPPADEYAELSWNQL